jgi:hypothetical protein
MAVVPSGPSLDSILYTQQKKKYSHWNPLICYWNRLLALFTQSSSIKTGLYYVRYGCGTWSLTLRKEHRLEAFENRMLRRIFGLTRDEIVEG